MSNNSEKILEMRAIVKDFPGVRALDHVDFSVQQGEVHCLLGENGAGKSTLIKILTGVYQPDEGEIIFNDEKLRHITPRYASHIGISAIYQELQLAHSLTIAENIFLGREPVNALGKIDYAKMKADTARLFSELSMEVNPSWLIADVSVGLRQMTEVVKVLARGGKLVIMDEPTTSLNEEETDNLFATVMTLKERGISVIYISHRMEEIFKIGDRATVLRDGKLVGTEEIKKTSTAKLVSMMVGHDIKEKFFKENVQIGNIMWQGKNLSSETGSVQGVDFRVNEGEILGLAGIRGSGYKELARMIGGIEAISEGELTHQGEKKVRFRSSQDAIQAGIGYLPEDRKGEGLVLMMSLRQNVVLPILKRISKNGWVDKRQAVSTAEVYVENLNIQSPSIENSVEFLSGGNQQKVVLAKWLASKCSLLVMDEPTQGIDVGAKIEMYKLMAKHVQEGGAVVMVSSELPELLAIADRIIVMRQGRLVGEIVSSESNQHEVLHLAAAGQAINT